MDAVFSCHNGTVYPGQGVYVVGSIEKLGSGDRAHAVRHDATSYPAWSVTMALPGSTNIEWECLKPDSVDQNTGIERQAGSDNLLNTGSGASTGVGF